MGTAREFLELREVPSGSLFSAAINCRIAFPVHYKSLTPPPAHGKAAAPIFRSVRCRRQVPNGFQGPGDLCMTDRSDLSKLPSYQQPRRSVFSARKIALMASVVAGLGAAVYGFGTSTSPADLFSSPAHAQVNNEVRKVERPIGFADIVERVKPSVISVMVNFNKKTASNDDGDDSASPFQPGSPMERFFRRFGGPDGVPGLKGGGGRG